jgi:hypothetical protein
MRTDKKENFKLDLVQCFRPAKGKEFCYLGKAYYRLDENGLLTGKQAVLFEFYRRLDRKTRSFLCPPFLLRLLLLAEYKGVGWAKRVRLFLIKGVEIEWMGWRWDKFRIKGHFTANTKVLARQASAAIEDSSHASWFV